MKGSNIIFSILIVIGVGFVSQSVNAGACLKRESVVEFLSSKHKEQPQYAGIAASGNILEVFTSLDGLTWTVTITSPTGISCVTASGESWVDIPKKKRTGS